MEQASELVVLARDAFARRDWLTAREQFIAAREVAPLAAADLDLLADAAWWLGLTSESMARYEEAFDGYLEAGQPRQAAMAGMGIAYTLSLRGDEAVASGWMGRSLRLLQDEPECAEHGFLIYLEVEQALAQCDLDAAVEHSRAVGAMGRRFNEPNLLALSVMGEGRARIKQGRVAEGMALLDEAMLAAVSEKLNPSWAGNIYCHLMLACHELADLRRAGQWTAATARWCESMPGAGPFMGICRVHRAQVLGTQGDWDRAEREVLRVCDELAHFHVGIVGEARYELAEIRRRRGDLAGAEEAFRQAHDLGRDPQPGLALLRLAQGRPEAALASIRAALAAQPNDRLARARLCAAQVEIALGAGDKEAARAASDELREIAGTYGSSGLEAHALAADGAMLLAAGDAGAALGTLRDALQRWQRLEAPYEAARVRLLLAEAYRALGDHDAASLEAETADAALIRLGAAPIAQRPAEGARPLPLPSGLTPREGEVLLLAAQGLSNSEIAETLVLSIRTVERHLATVYQKLGFQGRNARAAAVAFALREGIAPR